jgi:hypothetical protein
MVDFVKRDGGFSLGLSMSLILWLIYGVFQLKIY